MQVAGKEGVTKKKSMFDPYWYCNEAEKRGIEVKGFIINGMDFNQAGDAEKHLDLEQILL